MSPQERQMIAEKWLGLAAMYGKEIPRATLSLMLDAIEDLPADRVLAALRDWAKIAKNRSHPLPSDLIAQVYPVADDDSLAREAASRAIGAVSKFGWPNPTDARAYIGELGWRVVERYGGWKWLCENLGVTLDIGTFQAQFRDTAKSQLALAKAGRLDQPPGLPASEQSAASILKRLNLPVKSLTDGNGAPGGAGPIGESAQGPGSGGAPETPEGER